jgi:hypothetical protein
MIRFLLATGLILALLLGWLLVQQLSRQFSKRHPELGPHREEVGRLGRHGGQLQQQRLAATALQKRGVRVMAEALLQYSNNIVLMVSVSLNGVSCTAEG